MKKIISTTKKYYENRLKKFGNNYKGMNWPNKSGQNLRFQELLKLFKFKNSSIHDVGCGNGMLLDFLKRKRINFKEYLGTDISQKMIDQCKINFKNKKNINFLCVNIIKKKKIKKYDYVVSSGLFNIKNNFSSKEWQNYVYLTISKMFSLSKKGISFNLLTFDTTYRNNKLYYQSVDDLFKYCRKNISKKIFINHSYKLWEYTVYIFK